MSPAPWTEQAPFPRPDSVASTIGISRSKVRHLFQRRKSSNASIRPSTGSGHEPVPRLATPALQDSRPILSSRTRSEQSHISTYSRPRSADSKVSRKQDRMITDPPPLAQAYGQALLHAELETPTSFTEKSRYGSYNSRDQHIRGFSEDKIVVKRSHKRTPSGESTCSTRGKMFFLVNGPYVLQYDGDSNGDALPEKILVIDRDSVAVACDAVPGRPWVLQVSKPHLPIVRSQGQSLRPSWSRMTLRQSEDRRTTNTLLLIFDDSEELYTWLFAVRKEIEDMGGIEYRPDGEDDQAWREKLTRKFAPVSDPQPNSRKSSAAHTLSARTSPCSLKKRGDLGNSSRIRTHSTQSSTSSKKTSTSSDHFRDSVTSDGYTSTLATSCADGSASSTSPIHDTFPSINSVTNHANTDLSLRTYSTNHDTITRVNTSPKPRSLLERRKLSVSSLNLGSQADTTDKGHKYFLDLPSTISASPIDTLPQTGDVTKHDTENPRKQLSRNMSSAGSTGSVPKAKYSLFPVCPPAETKHEPLTSPSALRTCTPAPSIAHPQPHTKSRIHPGMQVRHQKSRSRTVTLELRQHRKSALLGAGEFSQPQRSPAVTDDMIISNFGVARDEGPASPMPEIKVPGLSDLNFDLDFLRTPYKAPGKQQSPGLKTRRTSSTRSASSTRHERKTSLAKAPVGPPPAGPLPEVPSHSRPASRTNRSSQQSQKSQSRKSEQHEVDSIRADEGAVYPTTVTVWPKSILATESSEQGQAGKASGQASKQRSRSRSRGRRRSGQT